MKMYDNKANKKHHMILWCFLLALLYYHSKLKGGY